MDFKYKGREKEYHKEYRLKNIEKRKNSDRKHYLKNKDERNEKSRLYSKSDEYKKRRNKSSKERKENDIIFKLSKKLRTRLWQAIKQNNKKGSAVRDLGCSIIELKEHLEKQFKEGMTWDNYGFYGWHIDHIKPLSKFNLQNREELLKAINYTNLQPMWWRENISKGNKTL